jgi:hypothetical protein
MPAPLRPPAETGNGSFPLSVMMFLMVKPIANHNLTELFVACQQLIEWFELAQRVPLKLTTHILVDKRFEPIPQCACLRRDGIEFTRNRALPQSIQNAIGNQSSSLEPREKVFSRGKPLDLSIHGNGDGVQEVEPKVVRNEKRWGARCCHGSLRREFTFDYTMADSRYRAP